MPVACTYSHADAHVYIGDFLSAEIVVGEMIGDGDGDGGGDGNGDDGNGDGDGDGDGGGDSDGDGGGEDGDGDGASGRSLVESWEQLKEQRLLSDTDSSADQAGGQGSGLVASTVRQVAHQALCALAVLHGHGWVHMDVKPSNLMRFLDGTWRLVDFGSAVRTGA